MKNVIKNRMYNIREDLDLKQYDVAKMFNVSKRAYSFWETNDRFIPLSRLNHYCNIFGVSMDYVFYLTNSKEKTNNLQSLDKVEIGKRLNIILKDNNLRQQDLANILNTTQSTISAYVNGETMILTAFAYQIAKKYNISLDWLAGRSDVKYIKS